MPMPGYSLSGIAAASGESGSGGNNAWWVIIPFAMTFGCGGNGNAGGQPVTEAGLVFNRLKCKSTDGRKTGTIRAFNIHDVVVCTEQGHDGVGRHLVCLGPVHTSDTD